MPKGLDYVINIKDGDFGGAAHAKSEMQGMDSAVEHTHEGLGNLKGMIGELATAFGIAFAVDKVVDFGKQSFEVYEQTAQAQAQIMAGIKSTAGAAGLSLSDLTEQADILAHKTLFSQEQTEQAESIELSFTNIKGAIFNQAIPAIEDLATRMGGDGPADLKGASVQLGKALQDPEHGIAALHRVGVDFSDAQKGMIKTMVEHGNVAGAQAVILKELRTEFGGSAEAARKTKGAIGDLDEQTHDLKEGFGKLISDGLEAVVPVLLDVMHWVGENKNLLIDIAKVVGVAAAAWGLYEIAIGAASAWTAVSNTYMAISNGLSVVASEYAIAQAEGYGVLTSAQWALNVAMDANPIGVIITGVGALIGLVYEAYEHCETFRAVLAGVGEIAEELTPIFEGLGEIILGAFTFDGAEITKGFSDAYNGVKNVIAHGGIEGAFIRGAAHSLDESHRADAEQKKKDEALKKGSASDLVHHGKETPYTVSTGKHHGKTSGDGSTTLAGGRSVRNVQVTIGKLVERLEVHTTNLQGVGASEIKRLITELLTESVHDSELALGSQ